MFASAKRLATIAVVALFGWPAGISAYLVPAVTVNPAVSRGHLPEVLIYYANATDPDVQEREDYRQIIHWLYDTEDPALVTIAREFEVDLTHFPMMVDRDLRAMEAALPKANGALAGIVVATNPLARTGQALVWKYPEPAFATVPLTIAQEDESFRSSPLAGLAGLNAVLSLAAQLFDPTTHRYVLITKSHGTNELALTPRLVTPASLGRERVLAIARGEAGLDHIRPGVTKAALATTLARFGRQVHMNFSLIFLESCDSSSGLTDLPTNVGTVVATDDSGAQSNTISYERYFSELYATGSAKETSASGVLAPYLARKAMVLNPHPSVTALRRIAAAAAGFRFLLFLPLSVLLLLAPTRALCAYWNEARGAGDGHEQHTGRPAARTGCRPSQVRAGADDTGRAGARD